IDLFPPVDRSDFYHKEFADELAHIISPPEYDHFYFDLEDDPIEFPEIDLLVSFPFENEDKVFDPGILIIDEVFSEVARFDPFLSLTQSVSMSRVMETPSSGFYHMPSPCPAAYSPKEVMY
ncbi:hypothetical protein Tco_1358051, partial [Tanacetum coccineum]